MKSGAEIVLVRLHQVDQLQLDFILRRHRIDEEADRMDGSRKEHEAYRHP